MARMISAAALLGLMLATTSLRAEEPACQRCEVGVPLLSKIPYMGRLFRNVSAGHDGAACTAGGCPGQAVSEELPCPASAVAAPVPGAAQVFRIVGDDGFERIGVDFDFNLQCTEAGCTQAGCTQAGCADAVCAKGSCRAVACETGSCAEAACSKTACAGCPTQQAVPAGLIAAVETQSAILEAYAGFSAELDVLRDKYEEQKAEMIDAIVATQIENATLKAKLEFAGEREKLVLENTVAKLQLENAALIAEKLQAENEQLKTQLADNGQETHSNTKLSKENAALKAKLAKLEARLAKLAAPAEATAEKPANKRKR